MQQASDNLPGSGPPRRGALREPGRHAAAEPVLVMCMEHLGDIVNTVPALRAIRLHHRGARIVAQVGERACELLRGCPYVDEVWPRPVREWPAGRLRTVLRIRSRRFGAVYILDRCNDKILLAWLGAIPARYGICKSRFCRLYSRSVQDDGLGHERLGVFRDLLSACGIDTSDWRLELFPGSAEVDEARATLGGAGWNPGQPLVALCLGAGEYARQWTPEGFGVVARDVHRAGGFAALVGSADDSSIAAAVRADLPHAVDLTGRLSIGLLVALLGLCNCAVACDTGPMHIAAALGVPVVGLFGPSDPRRTGPAGACHVFLRAPTSCGGPCPARPTGPCRCMAAIEPEHVSHAVIEQLAARGPCALPTNAASGRPE